MATAEGDPHPTEADQLRREEDLQLQPGEASVDLELAHKHPEEGNPQSSRNSDQLRACVADLQSEVEVAREQRASAVARLAETAAELADAEGRAQLYRGELEKAVSSRSWKLTRPLRALTKFGATTAEKTLPAASASFQEQPADASLSVPVGRDAWDEYGRVRLKRFLDSSRRLQFQASDKPEVSVILVFYNNAHLSLLCLESILANANVSYEVVIVDNGSIDETASLFERIDGATVLRYPDNRGFGEGCNQGVARSRGRYVFFLNNDALLEPGTLSVAIRNFERDPGVGAVGGKLLFANGRLQEAGSIVWADGSAWGYGRGEDPNLPQYEFRRPVDYCSGAFLITPTELFRKLGGFSNRFYPAYYEDTDYCTAVWANNLRVVYEPRAVIRHFESASSGDSDAAKGLITLHQERYVEKWREVLDRHLTKSSANVQRGRFAAMSPGLRIVYLDEQIPHLKLGSYFRRSNAIISQLAHSGYFVTCASMGEPISVDYLDIPRNVELFDGYRDFDRLVTEYLPDVEVVWISDSLFIERLLQTILSKGLVTKFKIIYASQDIFAIHERLTPQTFGKPPQSRVLDIYLQRELALAKAADAVVCAFPGDVEFLKSQDVANVHVVSHRLNQEETTAPFTDRNAFLLVGAMNRLDSQSTDAMLYFCKRVWPQVHSRTGATLLIAGHGAYAVRSTFEDLGAQVLVPQDDSSQLYNRARVCLAPARYSKRTPFETLEAAASGVPIVTSASVGQQLGWQDGKDCLVADDANAFAENCCRLYFEEALWQRIRVEALGRVRRECDENTFSTAIEGVLDSITVLPEPGTR